MKKEEQEVVDAINRPFAEIEARIVAKLGVPKEMLEGDSVTINHPYRTRGIRSFIDQYSMPYPQASRPFNWGGTAFNGRVGYEDDLCKEAIKANIEDAVFEEIIPESNRLKEPK